MGAEGWSFRERVRECCLPRAGSRCKQRAAQVKSRSGGGRYHHKDAKAFVGDDSWPECPQDPWCCPTRLLITSKRSLLPQEQAGTRAQS
jgi:hypothetical protein